MRSPQHNQAALQRALHEIGQQTRQQFDALAQVLFEQIRERTPEDSGQARAGWTLRVERGSLTWLIENREPHIVALEYGSSAQAPAGMVRVTLAEATEHPLLGRRAGR